MCDYKPKQSVRNYNVFILKFYILLSLLPLCILNPHSIFYAQ